LREEVQEGWGEEGVHVRLHDITIMVQDDALHSGVYEEVHIVDEGVGMPDGMRRGRIHDGETL
jgi:hypothetical protein